MKRSVRALALFLSAAFILPLGACSARLTIEETATTIEENTQEVDPMQQEKSLAKTILDLFPALPGDAGPAEGPAGIRMQKVLPGLADTKIAVPDGVTEGETVVLALELKAADACAGLTVDANAIGGTSMRYYIPTAWTRVYMPVKAKNLDGFGLFSDGEIYVGGARLLCCGKAVQSRLDAFCGQYLLEGCEEVVLSDGSAVAGSTGSRGMLREGDLLYAIGEGKLTILKEDGKGGAAVLGKLDGLGSGIRQIRRLDEKNLAITSRQDGVFIVNVTDPAAPFVVSRYDGEEMATGLATAGGIAFICNREYGLEVVDARDPEKLRQIALIRGKDGSGTAQSCEVFDGFLYCGMWNQMRVDIYDVRDPAAPVFAGSVNTHGRGDGVAIARWNGRVILYVATAQHDKTGITEDVGARADLHFGNGNGMDVFDVTDPANGFWLSTVRIDGRYYFPNNDYWTVSLGDYTDESGAARRTAYFTNTYTGAYAVDVTDPENPVRTAHYTVRSLPGSSHYERQSFPGRDSVFPYDQREYTQSPIGAVCPREGGLALASTFTGVHLVETGEGHDAPEAEDEAVPVPGGSDPYALTNPGVTGFAAYRTKGQAYRMAAWKNYLYLATGAEGILIFRQGDLSRPLATVPVEGVAMDAAVLGDFLFVAQREGGLGKYRITRGGLGLEEVFRVTSDRGVTRDVFPSQTGKFIFTQVGSTRYEIRSGEDGRELDSVSGNSQSYHRCILTGCLKGRYYAFYTCSNGKVFLYDCGENDSFERPNLIKEFTKSRVGMEGAAAVLGDRVLATATGGYYLVDISSDSFPSEGELRDFLGGLVSVGSGVKGMPTVAGNRLILCDRLHGTVTVADITDPASPKTLLQFSVYGNPDLALVVGNTVYIPLGYQGVMSFKMP